MLLLLILPFIILVRGSVYFHENYYFIPYISIGMGVLITSILLIIYFMLFYRAVTKQYASRVGLKRKAVVAFLVVLGYCIHALFFISTKNLKSPYLSKEVTLLHPIVRLAVSTVIIIDKDLIITDASRKPEDYRRMGLPTKSSSLHYAQKDGYAYAIDLRTNSRTAVRNFFLSTYFKLMGFNTLRHSGTGDHLHISLKCKYRPRSI